MTSNTQDSYKEIVLRRPEARSTRHSSASREVFCFRHLLLCDFMRNELYDSRSSSCVVLLFRVYNRGDFVTQIAESDEKNEKESSPILGSLRFSYFLCNTESGQHFSALLFCSIFREPEGNVTEGSEARQEIESKIGILLCVKYNQSENWRLQRRERLGIYLWVITWEKRTDTVEEQTCNISEESFLLLSNTLR